MNLTTGTYFYQDLTYHQDHLVKSGKCQPQDKYEWGVSVVLTFSFLVTTLALSTALGICLITYSNEIRPEVVDEMFTDLKTALAVATSIRQELKLSPDSMTNADLQRALTHVNAGVKYRLGSIQLRTAHAPEERRYNTIEIPTDIRVGSDIYDAYIRNGYQSLVEQDASELDRCYIPSP